MTEAGKNDRLGLSQDQAVQIAKALSNTADIYMTNNKYQKTRRREAACHDAYYFYGHEDLHVQDLRLRYGTAVKENREARTLLEEFTTAYGVSLEKACKGAFTGGATQKEVKGLARTNLKLAADTAFKITKWNHRYWPAVRAGSTDTKGERVARLVNHHVYCAYLEPDEGLLIAIQSVLVVFHIIPPSPVRTIQQTASAGTRGLLGETPDRFLPVLRLRAELEMAVSAEVQRISAMGNSFA